MVAASLPPIADIAPVRPQDRNDRSASRPEPENEKFVVPGAGAERPTRAQPERTETAAPDTAAATKTGAPQDGTPQDAPAPDAQAAAAATQPAAPAADAPQKKSGGLIEGLLAKTPAAPTAAQVAAADGTATDGTAQTGQQTAAAAATASAAQTGTGGPAGVSDTTAETPAAAQTAETASQTGQPAAAAQPQADARTATPAAQQTAAAQTAGATAAAQQRQAADQAAAASANGIDGEVEGDGDDGIRTITGGPANTANNTNVGGAPGQAAQTTPNTAQTQTAAGGATNGAAALNNQLAAQTMAGADTAPDTDLGPAARNTGPDGATVSHNFHAEMRAALDTPTQAAAYTARGATVAQPAAQQIAVQISRAVDQNSDKLTIQLKPAELGKVTVELEVKPDNRVVAVISAERSETLELLERDARSLERALNDAGLKTDTGSLAFSHGGHGEQANDRRDGSAIDGAIILPTDTTDSADGLTGGHRPLIVPDGRLDIQV